MGKFPYIIQDNYILVRLLETNFKIHEREKLPNNKKNGFKPFPLFTLTAFVSKKQQYKSVEKSISSIVRSFGGLPFTYQIGNRNER